MQFPHESLQLRAEPVREMTDEIWKDIEVIVDTFMRVPGVGLAAPQINIMRRIVIVDVEETRKNPSILINPILENPVGKVAIWETCLSFPQLEVRVPRARRVTVKALTVAGDPISFEAERLLSVVIQHEVDHLNGRVLLDYLPYRSRDEWIIQMSGRRKL